MAQPDLEDLERVERALGVRPTGLRWARGHGAPSNRRYVVELPSGETAFAKIAAFDYTADWLRIEHAHYVALASLSCLPRLLGWDDDGAHPALVIEDLSSATWPPPWSRSDIGIVLDTLDVVGSAPVPEGIDEAAERRLWDIREGWDLVRADPRGFLRLGLCSPAWLEAHIDELESASAAATIGGDALVHADVRSDNLCFRSGTAMLVDWNWACIGNRDLDRLTFAPSLAHEGGPPPWEIAPGHPELVALIAGFFCEHAHRPPIPQAPHVRQLQLDQGRVALAWAARELGLPPPA